MPQVAIDTSVFASDLVAMITDLPATAYFSTLPGFRVSVNQLTSEQTLLLVGNNSVQAVQAIFPISYLGTAATPTAQDRFALKMPGQAATANFMVVRTDLTQDGIGMVVTLANDNRLP